MVRPETFGPYYVTLEQVLKDQRRSSSTLSLNSALNVGWWLKPCPSRFTYYPNSIM